MLFSPFFVIDAITTSATGYFCNGLFRSLSKHASQESNLEPAALETAALPIELLAYPNLKSQISNLRFQITYASAYAPCACARGCSTSSIRSSAHHRRP